MQNMKLGLITVGQHLDSLNFELFSFLFVGNSF